MTGWPFEFSAAGTNDLRCAHGRYGACPWCLGMNIPLDADAGQWTTATTVRVPRPSRSFLQHARARVR